MFDTSSDFDQSNTKPESVPESETDIQLLHESQTLLLREQNEALTRENASLRAQFEEALRITSEVEKIHQEKRELKSENRDYQSQIETLNQRLEISSKTIDELNQKLEIEKQNALTAHQNEQAMIQKEIQNTRAQTKAQIDHLYEQIDQLNKAKEKGDLDQKIVVGKVERCIENAKHYFQINFNSFDELVNFLGQTPMKPPQDPPPKQPATRTIVATVPKEVTVQQLQKLGKRLKKERGKLKQETQLREELEVTIEKLKREQQDIEKKHQKELESVKKEFEQFKDDANMIDADQKRQISSLKLKIDQIKSETTRRKATTHVYDLQSVKSSPESTISRQSFDGFSSRLTHDDYDYRDRVSQLTQKNNELTSNLQVVTSQRDNLSSRVNELEAFKQEADILIDKSKNELKALNIVHKETMAELESLRNILHERESSKDEKEKKARVKREMQVLKSQINNLQSSLESQKKQAYELSLTNEKSASTITQLNQRIDEFKKLNEENEKTIETLKDDLQSAQHELADRPNITPETLMPTSVWRFPDFGSELSDKIEKVTMNTSLQPSSKLQNVYRLIYNHYNKLLSQRDSIVNDTNVEMQSIKHTLNQFLVNISIALGDEPVTIDDFFCNNGFQTLTSTISQMRVTNDDYKRSNDQYHIALNHFYKTLNIPPDTDIRLVCDQTNVIRDQLNAQTTLLQKRTKKCKELNVALKTLKRKYDSDTEEHTRQIQELNESNQALIKENEELTNANQQFKRDLQTVKSEFSEYKERAEENENDLLDKFDDERQVWEQERQNLLDEIQNNKNKSPRKSHYDTKTIEGLRRTIAEQKATISEQSSQLSLAKLSNMGNINSSPSTSNLLSDREKKQIVDTYEKAIAEITEKCNKYRSDVETMNKQLIEAEKKLKQAKSTIMQTKRENVKVSSELQALKEQSEREKKLIESSSKTTILNMENNLNNKLDEQKSKFDSDKRRIYGFVADAFKQYFNPHESIDDRSFKNIINRVKDELSRLSSSDLAIRRFVGAESHQKTDDAVAQLIMNGTS